MGGQRLEVALELEPRTAIARQRRGNAVLLAPS
jgi:hypothetical protein